MEEAVLIFLQCLDCKFVSIRRLMVVYFFSGTGSFAPFDMVTVNRSILQTLMEEAVLIFLQCLEAEDLAI